MVRALLLVLAACGRIGYDAVPSGGDDANPLGDDGGAEPDDAAPIASCGATVLLDDTFDAEPAGPGFSQQVDTGFLVNESGGDVQFVFVPPVAANRAAWYRTVAAYPADGLCVTVEPVELPIENGAIYFKLRTAQLEVEFYGRGTTLDIRTRQSGTVLVRATIELDLAQHALWRIRQSGTRTFWETSSDGASFVVRYEQDGVFTVNTAQAELGAFAHAMVLVGGQVRFARAIVSGP